MTLEELKVEAEKFGYHLIKNDLRVKIVEDLA